jgi:Glycosyl hydrolase catalytic core
MTVPANPPAAVRYVKKGVPIQNIWSARQYTAPQEVSLCEAMLVGWGYNYLPAWDTSDAKMRFLPMIFDAAHQTAPNLAAATAYGTVILGYNEPYQGPPQANIDPLSASILWPDFVATGQKLGSPTSTFSQPWLTTFQADLGSTEWDYTALHFYAATFNNPAAVHVTLDSMIATFFAQFGKRIILSEFGLIGFVGSFPTWTFPTAAQYAAQLAYSGPRLNADDRVAYWCPWPLNYEDSFIAINPGAANVRLADAAGVLTVPGQTYAALVNYP